MRIVVGLVFGLVAIVACARVGGATDPAAVVGTVASASDPQAEAATDAQAEAVSDAYAFGAFCDIWMQKLQDRASFNRGRIEWKTEGDNVVGEHVDYGESKTCVTRTDPGKEPIGKITYREVRYRRQGTTPDAALAAPGTVVERFDVTEIFRYADGRWQY